MLLKTEECSDEINMTSSCKMDDDHFLFGMFSRGLPQSSVKFCWGGGQVSTHFWYVLVCSADLWKLWIDQQIFGSSGQDPIFLKIYPLDHLSGS